MENNKSTITTKILLSDNGKEFDSGSAVRRDLELRVLSKEEALRLFDEGKRVYFIYPKTIIYREACRKICKDRIYLIEHYDFHKDVCGIAIRKTKN